MKVAVVTGANKGIGYGIVKGLCQKFDGVVYLTARNPSLGEAAVKELNKKARDECKKQKIFSPPYNFFPNLTKKIDSLGLSPNFHQLDITCQKSIDTFKNYLQTEHGGIDVLVNNAAIAYKNSATEPFGEQAENSIKVNYFGLLSVCNSFFSILRPNARVVYLSSYVASLTRVPGENVKKQLANPNLTTEHLTALMNHFVEQAKKGEHERFGWPNSAYAVSKIGGTALTFIHQRAFDEVNRKDIIVNAVSPGYCDTDMTSHKGPMTIEQGADAAIYLALLPPDASSPRGNYVWSNREIVDWVNGPYPTPY